MSLPYTDADPERAQWKAENGAEPVKKNKRAPKGPKPLYIPKWKEAQLAKMDAAAAAEKERFCEGEQHGCRVIKEFFVWLSFHHAALCGGYNFRLQWKILFRSSSDCECISPRY